MTALHVRTETRKVYVSARGTKLTKHAAYIAAAKKLIADRCMRWNTEREAAVTSTDCNGATVVSESFEECDRHSEYKCRFHAIVEMRFDHEGQPVDDSGRMAYWHRVLPRLVRFLKYVDRARTGAPPMSSTRYPHGLAGFVRPLDARRRPRHRRAAERGGHGGERARAARGVAGVVLPGASGGWMRGARIVSARRYPRSRHDRRQTEADAC
jgi:hypothetical protein